MISWRVRRYFIPIVIIAVVGCFLFFVTVSESDRSMETELMYKVAELQNRLSHAEMVNRERKEDVLDLSEKIQRLRSGRPAGERKQKFGNDKLDEEEHRIGRGALSSGTIEESAISTSVLQSNDVSMPSFYHYLPHLLNFPGALTPAFKLGKDRSQVSVVLGVPTVKRQVQSYLLNTLENLIENMDKNERDDTLIVVFAAESNRSFVEGVAKNIQGRFSEHLASGLIEVIAPSPHFYPNLSALPATLGDTPERTRWRTKQNLDFAYLMMYCLHRGTYYVQLEDDILSKPSFITTMKAYAAKKTVEKVPWIILDFCQLGFIAKLVGPKGCKKNKEEVWLLHKPSLFQHVGTHSSLAGKVQNLKDKGFGKVELHKPHKNPPATVNSDLKEYHNKNITITSFRERIWAKHTFGVFFRSLVMLSLSPSLRRCEYKKVILAALCSLRTRYVLRSGNNEHPLDRFYNTTVEVLPVGVPENVSSVFPKLSDGFLVTAQLPALIHFLLMFYADKPSDWLLDNMIQTKVCRFDQPPKGCKKNKEEVWLLHKPSLFQHVGTHSSLAGKVQNLKDKGFGKVELHKPHKNPPATVNSDLKEYHNYKLQRAYLGETYFWGLLPQPGDALTFTFTPPLRIQKYVLRSGNNEHPLDRFYNTTVEVLPVGVPENVSSVFPKLSDGFLVVGRFNDQGIAEGNQTKELGKIEKIRLTVHAESDKWAILSEIWFEELKR
ncbi:unnamed protein product [Notodromas monacha]|uniref:Alpha-1,3-mannosyl-glycoprotein 4-beta-N-acetylglucosaminyltransferase A n=1 Tax=Notodromas monacha TaxID=399045 RepID=A0A7R9BEI9_9CRUS|nr:unnamed protein product [Notodromas monacha]CAG0913331.1 unnamed protein product [Notodromas monacha]